jgi:6-phosphogluconate dehydrogenase
MVKAGAPVDAVIADLIPLLSRGDVIIDGGNSLWTDTIRREGDLARRGIHFVGSGVSGGEEGARFGPSLMPGGSRKAWNAIKPIWNAIAAKVDRKTGRPLEGAAPGKPVRGGVPCTAYIGPNGSGHYVKMVHNGIEYGDMQLISEAYCILRGLLRLEPPELADIFDRWNRGDLNSYLIEITADILAQRDPARPRRWLIDAVLDAAGQKGTGKWTSANALDMGVPAPTIGEAVFARFMSALKDERVVAARKLRGPRGRRIPKRGLVAAGVRLETEPRRHRQHLAGRLHHPGGIPAEDQQCLQEGPETPEPPPRPVLPSKDPRRPVQLAPSRLVGSGSRTPLPRVHERSGVLRRVPDRRASRQSASGPAGLLRRSQL